MLKNQTIEDQKFLHNEAMLFFASELMLLKEAIPHIKDDRISKAATLLISAGQIGAALHQLANLIELYSHASVILARSFMETIINFCYVCVCDDKEYRAFILHPIYKQYHKAGFPGLAIDLDYDSIVKMVANREQKQKEFKKSSIAQEALSLFSETKDNLNWTKKNLNQRIEVIKKWGKIMDHFISYSKLKYYSDASEKIHGSLYGCTYDIGVFDPDFDNTNTTDLEIKSLKDNSCILIDSGILIHECLTLISFTEDIEKIYSYSYKNRTLALNLYYEVLGKIPKLPGKGEKTHFK